MRTFQAPDLLCEDGERALDVIREFFHRLPALPESGCTGSIFKDKFHWGSEDRDVVLHVCHENDGFAPYFYAGGSKNQALENELGAHGFWIELVIGGLSAINRRGNA